jgi:hypothetical protein
MVVVARCAPHEIRGDLEVAEHPVLMYKDERVISGNVIGTP